MPIGRIVRAIAGFYDIDPIDGNERLTGASLRGKLKLTADDVLVGDKVEFSVAGDTVVIDRILPRESSLKRPYIANVDLILLVFAHRNPDPIPYLMTKFLVMAESSGIPYLLVLNKSDLVGKGNAEHLANIYRNYGYRVMCTSVVTHLGVRSLKAAMQGKTAVLSGPSGVGKSALLNMVAPGFHLQTGNVSEKIGRGKHTTREVQLLKIRTDCYAADTPGFTQLTLDSIEPGELASLFPDFAAQTGCKFSTCRHLAEPGCRVKEAVAAGRIPANRYQMYQELWREVNEVWQSRYR